MDEFAWICFLGASKSHCYSVKVLVWKNFKIKTKRKQTPGDGLLHC